MRKIRRIRAGLAILAAALLVMAAGIPARSETADTAAAQMQQGGEIPKEGEGKEGEAQKPPSEGEEKESGEIPPVSESREGTEEDDLPASTVSEALQDQQTMVADEDILLVRIGYEFSDGSFDEWARGTGFIVGQRYILTKQTLIDTGSDSSLFRKIAEEKGDAYKRVGAPLSASDAAEHIRFFVTDTKGNEIGISDTSMKNGMGLVVTKNALEIPACIFADVSDISLDEGMEVGIKAAGKGSDRCHVKTVPGTVVNDENLRAGFAVRMEPGDYFPAGAPVYDGKGHVTGMLSGTSEDNAAYSAKALEAFLSMNGVEYRTADKIAAMEEARETTENEEDVYRAEMDAVDKTALEESIRRAVSVETSDCTEETAARLEEALLNAKTVDSSDDATQQQVDEAVKALEDSMANLKEKGVLYAVTGILKSRVFIILTAAAAAALAAALLVKKGIMKGPASLWRKKKEKEEIPEDKGAIPDLLTAEEKEEEEPGEGSSFTTVLGGDAYLTDTDSGKEIQIGTDCFVIGKEKGKVDYCIAGNPTVSRRHCRIKRKAGEYWLEDLGSTNHTWYGGKPLQEFSPVLLEDNGKIRVSDAEFIFHISERLREEAGWEKG